MGSAAQYVEVQAPVAQVYAYWRDFSNFSSFMPDVEEVTVTGPSTSHWKVSGPLGKSVEWDAEIVEDIPNQRIAWKSVGDADVDNAGAVRFDDRGATTNIEVSLEYDPPGGKAGELVAELVKDPDKQVQRAIDGFRQVVESVRLGG
ncbi:MAG: SRPBCC family protein [Actinomycetota bacterium]|nr:SRPBCC family protein [Actinomycetota bacterium]